MTIVTCWDNTKGRRKEKAAAVRAAFPALRHIKSDQGIWWRVDQARNPAPKPKLPPDYMKELVFPYADTICLSDLQIPLMDASLLEKARLLVQKRGIKQVVFNGDTLDFASIGTFAQHEDASLQECLDKMAMVVDMFSGLKQYWVYGNHEDRLARGLGGQLLHRDIVDLVIARCKNKIDYTVTERYYALMESGPYSDYDFRFTHQRPYSRARNRTPYVLASKYHQHILSGHAHHLSIARDVSGRYWTVDAGTFQESNITGYIYSRDTSNPVWTKGFVTVEKGVPNLFFADSPQEWWDEVLK